MQKKSRIVLGILGLCVGHIAIAWGNIQGHGIVNGAQLYALYETSRHSVTYNGNTSERIGATLELNAPPKDLSFDIKYNNAAHEELKPIDVYQYTPDETLFQSIYVGWATDSFQSASSAEGTQFDPEATAVSLYANEGRYAAKSCGYIIRRIFITQATYLAADVAEVDFGRISAGSEPVQKTLTLRYSNGTYTENLTAAVSGEGMSGTIDTEPINAEKGAYGTLDITLTFTPSAIGRYEGHLTLQNGEELTLPLVAEVVPSSPVQTLTTDITAHEFTATWDKVENAEAYRVVLTQDDETLIEDDTDETAYTFAGLKANTSYAWQVASVVNGVLSDYSAAQTVETPDEAGEQNALDETRGALFRLVKTGHRQWQIAAEEECGGIIEVYDIRGRQVRHIVGCDLDLSDLAEGVYTIKASDNAAHHLTLKVILE